MTSESFHFLNGPLKGEHTLSPGQYREMEFDGEHLVLTEQFGGTIPDDLPPEHQRAITWALTEGEAVLLVKDRESIYLYLRSPLVLKAYSFLTKL